MCERAIYSTSHKDYHDACLCAYKPSLWWGNLEAGKPGLPITMQKSRQVVGAIPIASPQCLVRRIPRLRKKGIPARQPAPTSRNQECEAYIHLPSAVRAAEVIGRVYFLCRSRPRTRNKIEEIIPLAMYGTTKSEQMTAMLNNYSHLFGCHHARIISQRGRKTSPAYSFVRLHHGSSRARARESSFFGFVGYFFSPPCSFWISS